MATLRFFSPSPLDFHNFNCHSRFQKHNGEHQPSEAHSWEKNRTREQSVRLFHRLESSVRHCGQRNTMEDHEREREREREREGKRERERDQRGAS